MTIQYDPLPVTDWASSLAAEYEEERRNRAIWDQQRTARDKQAEAADPGVTALKVLESAIEFSGTAAKAVRDTKAKNAEKLGKKVYSEMTEAGYDANKDTAAYIQAKEQARIDAKADFDKGIKEVKDEGLRVREILATQWKGEDAAAKIDYFMNLTGRRMVAAQKVGTQAALGTLAAKWTEVGSDGEPSYAEMVASGSSVSEQLSRLHGNTFGPGGLNVKTEMFHEYGKKGWENFKLTVLGSDKVSKNKASNTANINREQNELQLGFDQDKAGETFVDHFTEMALPGSDVGIDSKQALKILVNRVNGISASGTLKPVAYDDFLGYTFKAPKGGKFAPGTDVTIEQWLEKSGYDVDKMEKANDAAWGKKADAERLNLSKAAENAGIQAAADPNNLKLPKEQFVDVVGVHQKEYIRINGVPSEKLTTIMEADPSEDNKAFWRGEVERAAQKGEYTRALQLLEDSGLSELKAEKERDLVLQESVRENQDAQGTVKAGSAKLVMKQDAEWVKTGLTPVDGGLGLIVGEVDNIYETAVTAAAANPETRDRAVQIGNDARDAEWTREGGGLIAGSLDPNDPRRHGKYVWFEQVGPNGEPAGYRNHRVYNAAALTAKKNLYKPLSVGDKNKLYDKVDTLLTNSGWVLGESNTSESIVKAIQEKGHELTTPISLLTIASTGKPDMATKAIADYLGVNVFEYLKAVTYSTVNAAKTDPALAKMVGQYDLDKFLTDDVKVKDVNIFERREAEFSPKEITAYMKAYQEKLAKALEGNKNYIHKLYNNPSGNYANRAALYASKQDPAILEKLFPGVVDTEGNPRMPYRFRLAVNKAKQKL